MRHLRSRRLPALLLAVSFLTLPALAGCNSTVAPAVSAAPPAAGSPTSGSPFTSGFATLSSGQTAAIVQDVMPALSLLDTADAAVADVDALFQEAGLGFGIQALPLHADHRDPGNPGHSHKPLPRLLLHQERSDQVDLGNQASHAFVRARNVTVAYDESKQTFTVTASIEHVKHRKKFTSVNTHVRIFDASKLDASVDPKAIKTVADLRKLKLPLLEVQHNLKITNAAGSHAVHRLEKFGDTTVTIHMEVVSDKTKSEQQIRIVKDGTLDKTTHVETGRSVITITHDGQVIKTIESTFTIRHGAGTATHTAEDRDSRVNVTVSTNEDGSKDGTVRTTGGVSEPPAGIVQTDETGSGTVTTASGTQSITL